MSFHTKTNHGKQSLSPYVLSVKMAQKDLFVDRGQHLVLYVSGRATHRDSVIPYHLCYIHPPLTSLLHICVISSVATQWFSGLQ